MLLLREQGPGCGVEMVQLPHSTPRYLLEPCLCLSVCLCSLPSGFLLLAYLLLLQPPVLRPAGPAETTRHWRKIWRAVSAVSTIIINQSAIY